MTDFEKIALSCPKFDQFSSAVGTVLRALPPEMRKRLRSILKNYFARYGIEGAYERMKDRTVGQIFAEYQPEDLKVIASGEVDGVRYLLTDPSGPQQGKGAAGTQGKGDQPV
jgi:hypothetical protein